MKKIIAALLFLVLVLLIWLYRPSLSLEKLKGKYMYQTSAIQPVGNLDVHYRKTGQGFPLLLVHGTSSSLHTWDKWHEGLSPYFTIYSMDLPGCGITGPNTEGDYSIEMYLEFLEGFTDSLGIDSFHIAGNSLGGHIAWEYAAHSPKIGRAVLIDPSGFHKENRKVPLVFKLGRKQIFKAVVEKLNVRPLIRKSLKEVYYNDDLVTEQLIDRYYDLMRRKGNRLAFVQKVANVELGDAEDLADIRIPVQIQWGREDEWIPPELADIFTEHIPDNELIVYDECGHVPQEELPKQSATDAYLFLSGVTDTIP